MLHRPFEALKVYYCLLADYNGEKEEKRKPAHFSKFFDFVLRKKALGMLTFLGVKALQEVDW